ncbi:MAG: glycoside hydrolase family protein [Asticcacaulis sp.]|uniref:lysozyme n=1 Tax=Asticcacaulis sp. TaxID=1872648 RepID=UPI003F7C3FDF
MRARLKVSRAGVELIKSFEGLRQTATRLPDGRWTLGYGHTFSAREGARVTQEDADALLRFDLLPIVDAINNLVLVPLNQNQFDALVSFCFNIGVENFTASTVLKRINEGKMNEAAQAMDAWRSAEFNGQTYVLAPLIRRRAAEKNLFQTPESVDPSMGLAMRPVEDASASPVYEPQPAARQVIDLNASVAAEMARQEAQRKAEQLQAEQQAREEAAHQEALRQEAIRQAEALAEARRAEEARLREEALRRERERLEAEQRAREQAERERQQQERLERERLEREAAARLEAARLDAERRERERLEAARIEAARIEAARIEAARLETEQRERERQEAMRREAERLMAERLAAEKLAAEQRGREQAEQEEAARQEEARREAERLEAERRGAERQQAEPANAEKTPQDDDAEKARKAEAAAALMRLYSPYGGGSLGRPLTAPKPMAPSVESFSQAAPLTPAASQTAPIEIRAEETAEVSETAQTAEVQPTQDAEVAPPETRLEPEAPPEPAEPVFQTAATMPPPVITALNPYARPQMPPPAPEPAAAPDVVKVARPEPVRLTPDSPLNWREQLQRPLPQDHQPVTAPSAPDLMAARGASHFDEDYGDDEGWTLDGGRVAVSNEDEAPEHASLWTMIVSTFWWIIISTIGLGCLGVAAGAYYKSKDLTVIRNGAFGDYMTWSIVMAAIGILCVSISVWLIMRRLGGLRD